MRPQQFKFIARHLIKVILLVLAADYMRAQCSISNVTITRNQAGDAITIAGDISDCDSIALHFSFPDLPVKIVVISSNATSFSVLMTNADGITTDMFGSNFACGSTGFKAEVRCLTQHDCGASLGAGQEILCPVSCPSPVTFKVTDQNGSEVSAVECLIPGIYTVFPNEVLPLSTNNDYAWFINSVFQQATSTPSTGFQVTVDRGTEFNVALSGHVGQCFINSNIDLSGCFCSANDIELHIDSCMTDQELIVVSLEAEVSSDPNEILTATLSLADQAGVPVGTQTANSELNDSDLNFTLAASLTSGTYTASLILVGQNCNDTLIETFIVNADSCSVNQPNPPGNNGGGGGVIQPPPNENQAGLDWCCVWMILNIIFLIISIILVVIAACVPNPITISLASIIGGLTFVSVMVWLILCPNWILIDANFCDLFCEFVVILSWIEIIVGIGFVIALIVLATGVAGASCFALGLGIDLTYLGTILAICLLVNHFIFHCPL